MPTYESGDVVAKDAAIRSGEIRPEDCASPSPSPSSLKPETPELVASDDDKIKTLFDGLSTEDLQAEFATAFGEEPSDEELSEERRLEARQAVAARIRSALVAQGFAKIADSGVLAGVDGDVAERLEREFSATLSIPSADCAALVVGAMQVYANRAKAIRAQAEEIAAAVEKAGDYLKRLFGPALEDLLRAEISRSASRKPKKSMKFLTGIGTEAPSIALRSVAPKVIVENPESALAWIDGERETASAIGNADHDRRARLDALRRVIPARVEVDKRAVAQFVKETGELPDGVDIAEGGETFSIKL